MLVDGNSLTYRAFHALPQDLGTASGQITNAVFGFTSMLINLMKDHEPDHIAVAFDRPEPTFRHEMTPTYKAQRESAPDILRQQMGLVREVLDAMAIPTLETIGFDDMIAGLEDLHHNTPVLVFTLAYGADADVSTLQAISGATGAHYYDATDPTRVSAVLGDLVTSF